MDRSSDVPHGAVAPPAGRALRLLVAFALVSILLLALSAPASAARPVPYVMPASPSP